MPSGKGQSPKKGQHKSERKVQKRKEKKRQASAKNLNAANALLKNSQEKVKALQAEIAVTEAELQECKLIAEKAKNSQRKAERMLVKQMIDNQETPDFASRILVALYNYESLGTREQARARKAARRLGELTQLLPKESQARWRELMGEFNPVYRRLELDQQQDAVDLLYRRAELTEPPSPYTEVIDHLIERGICGTEKWMQKMHGVPIGAAVRTAMVDAEGETEAEAAVDAASADLTPEECEVQLINQQLEAMITPVLLESEKEEFWPQTEELFHLCLRLNFQSKKTCPWPHREPFALMEEVTMLNEQARIAQEEERSAIENMSYFLL